ncbi:MAG: ADP-ribosylglycohydrolase family protein [Armatimonadota bacterium]
MLETLPQNPRCADKLVGCILGAAVGDALGLPREGLSRQRALRLFGPAPLGHRFLVGRGMISDDAEHACMVAQALLEADDDPELFARSLSRRLRGWLLGVPAGVGFATLRAIIKLWLGWSPRRSGVYSAGNGPAMRAPIIGSYAAGDTDLLAKLVRASTVITHTDPRAEQGALLVALAAQQGSLFGPVEDAAALLAGLHEHVADGGLLRNMDVLEVHLRRGASAEEFADALGLGEGVTGFINHTVPVALFCWLRYPKDFRQAVEEVILLGGDTDTTGAIVGGMMGATLGASVIPNDWLDRLAEWPRSTTWMRRLGARLAESLSERAAPLPLFWPGLLPRNLLFTATVLYHGFRRVLPPYVR